MAPPAFPPPGYPPPVAGGAQPQFAYAPPPPPAYAPPPPAYAPPPQAYAPPPAYAPQPQFAYAPQPGQGPMPPAMHWAVVLILAWFTAGLAGLIWSFKQAAFVKKIDPSSKAMLWMSLGLAGMAAQIAALLMAVSSGSQEAMMAVSLVMMLLNLFIVVVWLAAIFGMRASMVRYYNSVEPMGLRLSGAMTFFFNMLYLQYHFSRIAEWKRTGRLS